MRKLITGAFTSLDGVMQAPGGPEEDPTGGFKHGGWVAPWWDDTLTSAMNEVFSQPFDLLLGRRTYDIFAAHWPYVDTDSKSDSFDQLNADIATDLQPHHQVCRDPSAGVAVLAEQPGARRRRRRLGPPVEGR